MLKLTHPERFGLRITDFEIEFVDQHGALLEQSSKVADSQPKLRNPDVQRSDMKRPS